MSNETPAVPCRFGDDLPAVARFKTPYGCVCFPDDREQNLCAQHIIKWGVIDDCAVEVLEIYQPELAARLGITAPAEGTDNG